MKTAYDITPNLDGTLTVKVGRAVEHMTLVGKEKSEIFETVKWMLISKGAWVSDERLTEDLYNTIWKHIEGK